jgi:glycosyltransferase involved in cell wall biosynthesis
MGMGQEVGIAIGGKGGVGSGREMGMEFTLGRFESALNVAGYMVHNQESARTLKRWTKRDVWVIDHGSMYIPIIGKEDARKMLSMDKTYGININDDKIGFVFGFQSPNKNYKELVNVCKKIGMKLVISGARHERMNKDILGEGIVNERSIIFLNRFLTDMEVNLYALASDVLLFNYPRQDHYSVSGALHRTIGAGRPCILSNTRHFADVKEPDDGVLKFIPGDLGDLERKILEGLDKRDELGQKAREYADNTSWEKVAKRHLDIYSKYVKFEDKKEKEGEKEEERDNSSNSDSGDNSSEVVTNE